jgi:amino acid adenylation domain-containing protein
VRHLARRFACLLRGAADSPRSPISEVPLLGRAERRLLVCGYGAVEPIPAPAACIHELFEGQAARTPEATALVCGVRRLTYRELDERADLLARRLRSLGVGPESRVGLLLGRDEELVAAILGVLKAGAAYVPLDPRYPRERLAFMLEDSGAAALLTRRELLPGLPRTETPVLHLDVDVWGADSGDGAGSSVRPSASAARQGLGPQNLAYVIYTSGSTGRPKGVAISHASAAALLGWAHRAFSPEELAGVLFSTSVCFDLSVFELFAPLTRGGTVVVAEDALALPTLPARGEVTLVNTVPSAMSELVRGGPLPDSVLAVALAGEPLAPELAARAYAASRARRVLNLYGPTEDTTYSTCSEVARSARRVAIGRPLAGTRAYVLDAGVGPAPLGVSGELYLGGAGLARGYLDRPALTAERFVPDPLSGEPGARLYRTGDVARFLPGGEIEYLGRLDQQVKVRGYRVEPGEVEAALCADPWVAECAVVAREWGGGGRRLVAYVVGRGGAGAEARRLRERLRRGLPEYMVPAAFVLLDSLPLTPNGKLDRNALPTPEALAAVDRPDSHPTATPPRTPLEHTIAALWQETLGVGQVGVHDNFFDLGGHSMLLVNIHRQLREQLRADLPIIELFNNPTIAALASYIRKVLEPSTTPAPAVKGVGGDTAADTEQRARKDAGRERLSRRRQSRDKD